jgi:hypothetical protein
MATKEPGWELKGLSTEAKPLDAPNGSTFWEMDTGKVYAFDAVGNRWIEQ